MYCVLCTLFFLYLLHPSGRVSKSTVFTNHNLISVRHRKYRLIILLYLHVISCSSTWNLASSRDPEPRPSLESSTLARELLLLDGGEVGVPHEGDQVGEEHPVLRSHQVDVHNLRKIYKESEVAFARQFRPVGLSRSSSWPARRSSSWTQPHFWHCHDWIPANG